MIFSARTGGLALALLLATSPAAAAPAAEQWAHCDGYPETASLSAPPLPARGRPPAEARLAACDAVLAEAEGIAVARRAHLLRARAALNIAANRPAAADADLAQALALLPAAGLDARAAAELRHGLHVGQVLRATMRLDGSASQAAAAAFADTNKFDLPKLRRLGELASLDPALSLPEREIYSQMFRINPLDMRRLIDALAWDESYTDAALYWEQHLRIYETEPAPADPAASPAPYRRFPLIHRVEQLAAALVDVAASSHPRRQAFLTDLLARFAAEQTALKPRLAALQRDKDRGMAAMFVLDEFASIALTTNGFAALTDALQGKYADAQAALFRSRKCNVLTPRTCFHPVQKRVLAVLIAEDYPGKDSRRLDQLSEEFKPAAVVRRNFEAWDGDKIIAAMTAPVAPAQPAIAVTIDDMERRPDAALGGAQPILLTAHWRTSVAPDHRKMAMLLQAARDAQRRGMTHLMPVWATPDHGLTDPALTDHPERLAEQRGDQMIVVLITLADVPADKRKAVASVALSAAEIVAGVPAELVGPLERQAR